jgi:hypothetical protein
LALSHWLLAFFGRHSLGEGFWLPSAAKALATAAGFWLLASGFWLLASGLWPKIKKISTTCHSAVKKRHEKIRSHWPLAVSHSLVGFAVLNFYFLIEK